MARQAVGVVGSRKGANLDDVRAFIHALYRRDPDALLLSGGARGVDLTAEREWVTLGGTAESIRPAERDGSYVVERWTLASTGGSVQTVPGPTFADFTSAALYRDLLIAQECERLVAFQRVGAPSPGTTITCGFARDLDKPVYLYTPDHPFRRSDA